MQASVYHPVDSANGEIRLLVLHPATTRDAEICCDLEVTNLKEHPPYEAISYTWGSVGTSCRILLNRREFQVHENAAAALKRLRLPQKRYLWVDALCINQDDLAERAAQVPLMRCIYGQAQQVCVWLGELAEGGIVGIRELQNSSLSVGWEQWKIDRKYGTPMLSATENIFSSVGIVNRGNLVDEQMNGEIRELLTRPWWRRTWIIQEAVLAERLVIMVGSETLSWESIRKCWERQGWTQGRMEVFGVRVMDDKDRFPDEIYRTISELRERWHTSSDPTSLLDVLYLFRLLECTNPRDRIYGFLGIVSSRLSLEVVPDYTRATADIFTQFVHQMIRATKCLDVLNCAREWQGVEFKPKPRQAYSLLDQSRYYDVHALIEDAPGKKPRRGWARLPDGWERIIDSKLPLFRDHNTGQLHNKSPLEGQPPRPAEFYTKQRILPHGWSKKWDNLGRAVVAYGSQESREEAEERLRKEALRSELSELPSWVPNWALPTPRDPAVLIDWTSEADRYRASGETIPNLHSAPDAPLLSLEGLVVDEIWNIAPPWHPETDHPPVSGKGIKVMSDWEALAAVEPGDCPYKSTCGRTAALRRTMIADYAGHLAAPDEDLVFVEVWRDRVGWAKDPPDLNSLGIWDLTMAEQGIHDLEEDMAYHCIALRPPESELGLREGARLVSRVKEQYGNYMRRIHRACAHRSLFVTRRGHMGLAPWNARVGDQVAILHGGRTPYLLRTFPATEAMRLVGEAYVYGLMAGEAVVGNIVGEGGVQVLHVA